MPEDSWPLVRVEEIADRDPGSIAIGPFGSAMKADTYTDAGVPVIRGTNLTHGKGFAGEFKFVSDDTADRLARCTVREGDLVFPHRGAIGEVGLVPHGKYSRWILSTSLMKLSCAPEKAVPEYVYYFFKSALGRHELLQYSSTVGTPGIGQPLTSLKSCKLPLPPLHEQRRIAEILGALDDKIELNRKMNQTLEEMAQAIFKSWFMAVSTDTAKYTIGDLMAEGVMDVGDGYRAKRSELADTGLPFARAGNINDGFRFEGAELLGRDSVKKVGNKQSRIGDVVFTSKGTVGRFAYVSPGTPDFVYSPQLCYWRSLSHKLRSSYLFYWMRSTEFLDQVAAVKGQTDMAEYVSLRDQRRMLLCVPSVTEQDAVASRLDPLLARQAAATDESATLSELRDTLLPKLISGELRVPEAENVISEAV